MTSTDRNESLFERAKRTIPGGVNSPVRAFKAVGGTPRFVKRAQGAYFWDANDQKYIDYIGSWGPMILGHGHPAVLDAVQKAALEGFSKSLAREVGKAGITVNCVAPGYMQTDMTNSLQGDKLESVKRRSPLGRLATPDDAASAVLYLLSEQAAAITGTVITVDAGSTA